MLDYLSEYGEIGEDELQELLRLKQTRTYLVARQMCDTGLITVQGRKIQDEVMTMPALLRPSRGLFYRTARKAPFPAPSPQAMRTRFRYPERARKAELPVPPLRSDP